MNTAEALIIAVGRLEDILKDDDGQAWKETARVLPQLQQAAAAAKARQPATEQEYIVAWHYELAVRVDADGTGSGWVWHLTVAKPFVPKGMIRNLRPLTYADQISKQPATDAVVVGQEVGLTLTESERVKCLVDSGCIGTVKMTYDSGPYEITRTSINADKLIESIIAALRAKGQS